MKVRTVLIWEGIANAFLALAKACVGFHTGSAAILGDALHSLTDLANNGIALFATKISEAPPDRDHPYGHQKFEQLAVFTLAGLLTVVAFELIMEALTRFSSAPKQSILGLVILIISLIVNVTVATWERFWAKRLNSDILMADAHHTLGDIFTTSAVIIGWQLSIYGFPWLDPLFALVVAGLVLYLAFDLFRRAIPILVDSAVHDEKTLAQAVIKLDHVCHVIRVRSRYFGKGTAADVIVTVDPNMSTENAHEVADAIEKLMAEQFSIHDTTVHIEPDKTQTSKPY